ncbi:MAG: hypothetical protein MJA83_04155 [Gammaproteobacteria bacterium]|nr:hypothetical protein [Gammaproteobacteria bacterium]
MVAKKDTGTLDTKAATKLITEQFKARRAKLNERLETQHKRMLSELNDPKSPRRREMVLRTQIQMRKDQIKALQEENKVLRGEIKEIRGERRARRKGVDKTAEVEQAVG